MPAPAEGPADQKNRSTPLIESPMIVLLIPRGVHYGSAGSVELKPCELMNEINLIHKCEVTVHDSNTESAANIRLMQSY